MTIVEHAGPITGVRLSGRLDVEGADAIGVRFTASMINPGLGVIVDFREVSFIASMGMRLLISTARALRQKDLKLVLFGANELVQAALTDAALDQILPCVATLDDALAQFNS